MSAWPRKVFLPLLLERGGCRVGSNSSADAVAVDGRRAAISLCGGILGQGILDERVVV